MYKTEIASETELQNWNQIISKCPYSEALHTLEWRNALTASFRQLVPMYLVIKDESDNIAGAVPCFIFQPIPGFKAMLSMPWSLHGGPLLFPDTDIDEACASVVSKMNQIAEEERVFETVVTSTPGGYNEIESYLESTGYSDNVRKFTHILDTGKGFDAVWTAYNKRVRGAVRKAKKKGVIVRETEDEEDLTVFYRQYMDMMERFQSTPKPYSLFRYLQTSPIARLVVAELDGQIIGGLLFLYFNSCVRLWVEASDPEYLSYRPNNAIINYIVEWACDNGYPSVDFGASPPESEGLIAFKEEWKAEKVYFHTFSRLNSWWKKKMWVVSEPMLRRVYAALQKFRLRNT
ncbi:GNAT family N-acetyltransferase [Candidatus Poribacteria bacterium]|nr:GNAT family N-acetyltransferase [Candidatus Poribacteria bacterium]